MESSIVSVLGHYHGIIKDPLFFQRLENSKYCVEDKDEQVKSENGIFNDLGYQDADYYAESS